VLNLLLPCLSSIHSQLSPLSQDDFEQFAWTIVFLAMGGIALGKGVTTSGLIDVLGDLIRDLVGGLSLYAIVLVLSIVVLVSILSLSSSVVFLPIQSLECHWLFPLTERSHRLFPPSFLTPSRPSSWSRLPRN
jgi:di/tricarboxylate transporter